MNREQARSRCFGVIAAFQLLVGAGLPATAFAQAPAVAPVPLPPLAPGQVRDCPDCPLLVTLPAGEFQFGTSADSDEVDLESGESPPVPVRIARPLLMARSEVTIAQFRSFVTATGHQSQGRCQVFAGGWAVQSADWQTGGQPVPPTDDTPVTCVSWDDARAYVEWLSTATGKKYRLPSEAEWEYAARGGTTGARSYSARDAQEGAVLSNACDHANTYDISALEAYPAPLTGRAHASCRDGAAGLAPVGRYASNAFDLVDMIGNAREWTQDCHTASHRGGPQDGRAWEWAACSLRTVRGGSFLSRPFLARSAAREVAPATFRAFDLGFRVARDADPPPAPPAAAAPAAAPAPAPPPPPPKKKK